jgi:hypothetical protein
MLIPVYRPTDWIDAAVHSAKNPLRIVTNRPSRAQVPPAAPARPTPQPAPAPAPGPAASAPAASPLPPAATPALFSGAYAGEIYARRLRVVMALQAEAEVAAAALAERRARGRS